MNQNEQKGVTKMSSPAIELARELGIDHKDVSLLAVVAERRKLIAEDIKPIIKSMSVNAQCVAFYIVNDVARSNKFNQLAEYLKRKYGN